MFKNFFVIALLIIALFYGCNKENSTNVEPAVSVRTSSVNSYGGFGHKGTSDYPYSASIPVDSANRMIQSYLYSINYPANDSGLRSLSFSADSLRAYLSNTNIKTIKFMLAHQPGYINDGHFGQYAGMNPEALTVVIVGTGTDGFILNTHQQVYEHCAPCPDICDGITSPYIH